MEETLSLTLGVIILTFVLYQRFNTLPEIGKNHENFIIEKAIQHGLLPLEFKKDLSGVNRVIVLIIK